MEEKKNNIWLLIAKVALIFLVFEALTKVLGGLIASKLYSSLLNGKYIIYAVSEFVVFVFAIVLLIIRKKWYIFKEKKINFGESVKLCLPILVLSVIIALANATELIGTDVNVNNLISLIIYVVLIGLFEEIFFRGIIENELLEKYSSNKKEILISIIISGIVFGAVHLTNLLAGQDLLTTMMQFVQTTAIGILFGTVYYKTRNIWAMIFLHSFYDFSVLLSEVNLVTDCGYVSNVPISITAASMVASIILSLIYLLYSASIFEEKKTKIYNNGIFILIALFFISNILFGLFGASTEDYYVCTSYDVKEFSQVETHYYSYDDFNYTLEDGTIYHIYKKDNKAVLEDNIGVTNITFDIDNVDRVVVIDKYLIIITNESANDVLYYKDLNNINEEFKTLELPMISSVGYLYSKDDNMKYPLVKSYINDLFVLDGDTLKKVESK